MQIFLYQLIINYSLHKLFIRHKHYLPYHKLLVKWNSYYRALSEDKQREFRKRVYLFIKTSTFLSDNKLVVNENMKVIISSAFVQITFGLNVKYLKIFNTIFIAAQPYSYKNRRDLFHGDVNINTKRVTLAWPIITKGFAIEDDALNLCIHEFGHCLLFENTSRNTWTSIFDEQAFDHWKREALIKYQKIKENKNTFLRDYGGTNLIELFSVCLEAFFEQPEKFNTLEPKLYKSICLLLKQDPLNKINPILK